LASAARPDGFDILFTDSTGTTKLLHEIESFDHSSGTLAAWVQIPALLPNIEITIYMYYGNASASPQQSPQTWDANYKAVYHLSGSPLNAGDSTANANNGAAPGVTGGAGKISGGGVFNGTNADIATPYTHTAVTAYTAEAWINVAAGNTQGAIVLQDRGTGAGHSLTLGLDGTGAGCGAPCVLREAPGS
jgi:hypothetical protein